MKTKKSAYSLLILMVLLVFVLSPQTVKADVNVAKMKIDVTIRDDGSALITQQWDSDVDEGTEFYLYQKDSGYLKFRNLKVSDSKKSYKNIGDWDVDADFEEKAYKCGINKVDDGVELCWGVSRYGKNSYTISYELDNLMRAYNDNIGCLYRFVNADMDFFPTNVELRIHMENGTQLSKKNAKIWGFGYDGDIVFSNGEIVAKTSKTLEDDANMTLMIALDKDMIKPAMSVEEAFQDTIDKAAEDSSYIEEEFGDNADDLDGETVLAIVLVLGIPILLVIGFVVYVCWKDKKEKQKLIEEAPYYYTAPNEGNLNATYVLGRSVDLCKDGALVGARIISLMLADAVTIDKNDTEEYEGMRTMRLNTEVVLKNPFDKRFFEIMKKAAGKDEILKPKKFKKYCEKHYSKIEKYLEKSEEDGKKYLKENACIQKQKFKSWHNLNEKGMGELNQVIGLYKYIKHFGDDSLAEDSQQCFWKELLPYTSLFKEVDEFENGLKNTYDDYTTNILPFILFCHYSNRCSDTVQESISTGAMNQMGSGGSASIGGGAGFSGGGGGGVR